MWLLHFMPDSLLAFIVDATLILGVAATVLTCFLLKYLIRFVPVLAPHIKTAQILSVLLLLSGVYFRGGYSAEMAWRERVHEMEQKVAQAEQQAREANQQLEKKAEKQVQVIRQRGKTITQYIETEIVKRDNQCVIPPEFVRAHNMAAERVK